MILRIVTDLQSISSWLSNTKQTHKYHVVNHKCVIEFGAESLMNNKAASAEASALFSQLQKQLFSYVKELQTAPGQGTTQPGTRVKYQLSDNMMFGQLPLTSWKSCSLGYCTKR